MDYVKIARVVDRIYAFLKNYRLAIKKSMYARKRVRMIGGGYRGSRREFRGAVSAYWKKYGQHPKMYWYRLLCNFEGKFNPRYIPDSMWYAKILPYFNNTVFRSAYADKTIYARYLPFLKQPVTIVKNSAGHFYDGSGRWIAREEGIALLLKAGDFIIKPALRSGGGNAVRFFAKKDISHESIAALLNRYRANFVVQGVVRQHPDLARIHPQSLNTVRVISLHFKGKVHVLSAQLRMGAGGASVDNVSSGGIACRILDGTGQLADRAVTRKSEWTDRHPGGMPFRDIVVPSYDKILAAVEEAHRQIPFFNLIGWDFAVDEQGDPVFIEFNVGCEQNQIASGPTFGDLTEEVLEDVFLVKSLKGVFD